MDERELYLELCGCLQRLWVYDVIDSEMYDELKESLDNEYYDYL